MKSRYQKSLMLALSLCWAMVTLSQEDTMAIQKNPRSYSPAAAITHPVNVYFGDTHLHTNLSVDAYGYGNKRLGPDEAYRFAKGEVITAHNGMQARLSRPLDFLVIADHAENMGVMQGLESENSDLLATESGRRWHKTLKEVQLSASSSDGFDYVNKQSKDMIYDQLKTVVGSESFKKSVWNNVSSIADNHNESGKFTALIGYEWTGPSHIHRVIIFKDGADKTVKLPPFSNLDSSNPEDLWAHLSRYEEITGGQVLAIPHNGNLTMGNMFKLEDSYGQPFSVDYAKMRARWEPLVEVTQTKGDSETHPLLSPEDEFADYETWEGYVPEKVDKSLFQFEYTRSSLKKGLAVQSNLGINPFKFGMIGSTDAHTSLSAVAEDNFYGLVSTNEPKPSRAYGEIVPKYWNRKGVSASGYAAVWAQENTRDSLFAAMKRKEVYATTGPRMKVRFFGGWNYDAADAFRADLATIGYNKGVPMGGDLTNAPIGMSPNFLIRAVRDPNGANLDRVQIIKGWRTASGELEEKVYDVALSDGRKVRWNGKVKPVGSTVDIKDASYSNSIGDPELAVVWTDPDFNPDEFAFYYVRVLEIPTPRWTAYDAKFFGLKDLPNEIPMVTQERAYTSPIWFSPSVMLDGTEFEITPN